MTIDMEMIEAIVAAGATGAVVLAFLKLSQHRTQRAQPAKTTEAEHETKPKLPRVRRPKVDTAVVAANAAQTVDDTPRARLFREGSTNLVALGVAERTARQLIGKWLKTTNDDCQLVTATINRALELQVSDATAWILASLKGKTRGQVNGRHRNSTMEAFGDLISGIEGDEVQRASVVIDLPAGSYQTS